METNCAHDLVKYLYVIFLIRSHIIIKLLDFWEMTQFFPVSHIRAIYNDRKRHG